MTLLGGGGGYSENSPIKSMLTILSIIYKTLAIRALLDIKRKTQQNVCENLRVLSHIDSFTAI